LARSRAIAARAHGALPCQRTRRGPSGTAAGLPAHAAVLDERLVSGEWMVHMEAKRVSAPRMRWSSYGLAVLWVAIGAGALLTLAKSVQNSSEFSRLQPWILLTNLVAVVVLTVLLGRKVWQLVQDYRHHAPGSRLTARTVAIFGALVIAPLLIVYLFSLDFLNRGIDSWFKVEVKQGLNDALVLSGAALNLRMREYSARTEELARSLASSPPGEIQERID